MEDLIILFGSNIGNSKENILLARDFIKKEIGTEQTASNFYESEPWGYQSKNWYLNQVAIYKTDITSQKIITQILKIEEKMGRIRAIENIQNYTDRIIDIDVLFIGKQIIQTENLIVPHPRIQERKFVLYPLNELIPGFIHPVLNKDISSLTSICSDTGKIRAC